MSTSSHLMIPNKTIVDNAALHQPHIDNKSIVSILCLIPDAAMASPSLGRTLSANMSCLFDKRNTSFNDSDDGQLARERKSSSSSDIWSSILSQNQNNNSAGDSLPPPYVHPKAKRSKSCTLSERSLAICTENLGSETGSDGFPSYPLSEKSAGDYDTEDPPVESQLVECCDFSATSCRRSVLLGPSLKSFPPPLPSLAVREDGSNLHMCSHRENGRLVVEAVAVPSQNCFRARRQDGRLLLSLAGSQLQLGGPTSPGTDEAGDSIEENNVDPDHNISPENESENSNIAGKDEQQCEESNEGRRQQKEVQVPKFLPAAQMFTRMNVTKIFGLTKTTTPWPPRFNEVVSTIEEEIQSTLQNCRVATLITTTNTTTPLAAAAAAEVTSLNAYECYWRTKPTPVAVLKPLMTHGAPPLKVALSSITTNNNNNSNKFILAHSSNESAAAGEQRHQQELLVVKGKKVGHIVPLLKGCKEQRRSLLFLTPYCIASS